jgi:acyl-CoA thioester hydrolase
MYLNETNIRVRYAETDQMGYVYYGNYAQYCEVGRVEALRSLGLSYKEMEDDGVMLPVINYNIDYFKPAIYDDLLTIKTYIKQIPSVRIKFDYEIFNEKGILLNKGETTLVFVNKQTGKPCQPPVEFAEKIQQYFK